jgi:diacylglycerol O-acyltransferase / wax synthase
VSLDRLEPADALMVWAEDHGQPTTIGVVAILEGTPLVDADGRVRLDVVRDALARRLHRVPRLQQVVHRPATGLGPPLWVEAEAVDLGHHVRLHPLGPPGDDAELLRAVEQLGARRLDTSRPLWELWFLPGLADGRVAVFGKLHHAVADGVAGVALLRALLDDDAPPASSGPARAPSTAPSTGELLRDLGGRRLRAARRWSGVLRRPREQARHLARSWRGLRELAAARKRAPRSGLDRPVGPGRRLAVVRGSLDDVRRVGHEHGATVNDVLLTAVAGGLRALLLGRDEPVDGPAPQAYVPVAPDPRGTGERGGAGMVFVPLPVDVEDAVARLRAVAAATADRKRHIVRVAPGVLGCGLAAPRLMMRLAYRQRWADVYVADVPGPRSPLSLAGAAVLDLFPVVPLSGRMTLGVGALSYGGRLGITVVADRDAVPDVAAFTEGVRAALAELGTRTPAPTPVRGQARSVDASVARRRSASATSSSPTHEEST